MKKCGIERLCVNTSTTREKPYSGPLALSVYSGEASSRLKPSNYTPHTPPAPPPPLYSALRYAQSSHLHEYYYSTLQLLKYLSAVANIYRIQLDFFSSWIWNGTKILHYKIKIMEMGRMYKVVPHDFKMFYFQGKIRKFEFNFKLTSKS